MRIELVNLDYAYGKLCFVKVDKTEALAIIQSLTTQMLLDTPNAGRLESRCLGDATEFTIAVI